MIYLELGMAAVGSVARLSSSSVWTVAVQIKFLARKWRPVIPFETKQKLTCVQTHRPDSSVMTSFLTILYEDLLIGEQVDVQTTVHEGLLRGEQADAYSQVLYELLWD